MKLFLLSLIIFHLRLINADEYEDKIEFIVFNNATGTSFISKFNRSLSDDGCNVKEKFAFFTHGWMGSSTSWINDLMRSLSFYRGGCVIFMNYSYYSDDLNYLRVLSHFQPISQLVARKLNQLRQSGVSSDNIYMFGFSFGGRIVIEAAFIYGPKEISSIDTCDMAGPGFDFIYNRDPKDAAKNVQCVHTTDTAGTKTRNCHQDWLMGYCGKSQEAGEDFQAAYCAIVKNCSYEPINSHTLCPYFYVSAFEHNFIANNYYNCSSTRLTNDLPVNFKMGYMEDRKSSSIIGDIAAPTSKHFPYTHNDV